MHLSEVIDMSEFRSFQTFEMFGFSLIFQRFIFQAFFVNLFQVEPHMSHKMIVTLEYYYLVV